jgi:hypothetical protein
MELHVEPMKFRLLTVVASLAVFLSAARSARADVATRTFALIVTNNRSGSLSMPELQYADDDGARYYRLFRSLAGERDAILLTTFDRASRSAYPDLVAAARRPIKSELERAIRELAQEITGARERGERTAFYLVFAGHGDVSKGRGYLELEDAQIDGAFLEKEVIERIGADTKHILLDSCNSFFVINPRKPGGRRWATPKDMALGFSARHPEVGLFLSTNSESEVFEWSEIESGVFSHEVRSGLTGAADVNGDGAVSYAELAGFVERANAGIARESLRPHLFYRGPNGDRDATFLSPAAVVGRRVILDQAETRLWIKNAEGERLVDLHKETGSMTLVLAGAQNQELSIFVESKQAGRTAVSERTVPAGSEPVNLAEIPAHDPAVAARGDRIFASLFDRPYGPSSFANYLQEVVVATEPVYGISEADLVRIRNYLSAFAQEDANQTKIWGWAPLATGSAIVAVSIVEFAASSGDREARFSAISQGATGAALGALGLWILSTPSEGEKALRAFDEELRSSQGSSARAFARAEERFAALAKREREVRRSRLFLSMLFGGVVAAAATADAIFDHSKDRLSTSTLARLYGTSAFVFATGIVLFGSETSTERLIHIYRDDPGLKLHFSLTPGPSSLGASLSGRF